MRIAVMVIGLASLAVPAAAQQTVSGYVRKDGVYVAPYVRTQPNNTNTDNYSTRPNTNPYTGKKGTAAPDYTLKPPKAPKPPASSYKPPKPRY